MKGRAEMDAPNFSKELGVDNRTLDPSAQLHYLHNRLRCPECSTNFCRSCAEIPYHSGFTCPDYIDYKTAKHCRFCSTALTQKTKNPDASNLEEAFQDVCNAPLCVEKISKSCTVVHEC